MPKNEAKMHGYADILKNRANFGKTGENSLFRDVVYKEAPELL
jgi:hypothetical protein